MQDKYTGDVGDFGKYILLNGLVGLSGGSVTLGVNWYYVAGSNETNNDGRQIGYLRSANKDENRFEKCSPAIYHNLRTIIASDKRKIAEIENNFVLPAGTIFYSEPLPVCKNSFTRRKYEREMWFHKSILALNNADTVFLDPDNGISNLNVKKTQSRAIKYAFADEIEKYCMNGKSLIVYNHRDRSPKNQYDKKIIQLQSFLPQGEPIRVLRYKRISVRDYIFLPLKKHARLFNELFSYLTNPPFDFLFEEYLAK